MWGQISHAVLLLLVNIILKASCKGNGSLTFLIDDTSSMSDDIKQVRESVHRIKDIVLHEKSSLIDNMVLITLNDPGVHERIVTRDLNEFKTAINAIQIHNEVQAPGLDCWEPVMKGLLLALDKSQNNSFIFVFTDAPAKDYIDSQSVIEMCQEKQTQIVFVLTGTLCGKFNYPAAAINAYFDIAVACSGLAIFVQRNEVNKVFGLIEEIIKGNKIVITTATIPAGVTKKILFSIDEHTDYVIVSANGKDVSLKINRSSISAKDILSTYNSKVIKLRNVKPGIYDITVKGKTKTFVMVVGKTDFFFSHGFSESKPKSLSDTSQTIEDGAEIYLSVSVTDDQHSVQIVSAQLLDMDGKPIQTKLPLTEIFKDFYITNAFIAPSQMFKVAVNGIELSTNNPISRTTKLPVTPSPPKIAPKVQGLTLITVKKGESAQLECKVVRGFPAPKITWQFGNKSGLMFTPIYSDSVLIIPKAKDEDEGKYKCIAENGKGKDEHVTKLFILDMPKIDSSVTPVYESTEGDALLEIPCIVSSPPNTTVTWKLEGRVISQNNKYSIENGTLIIKEPKVSDSNWYTCEAENKVSTVSMTFKTYIRELPKLSSLTTKTVRTDTPVDLECMIDRGEQTQNISWQFMDTDNSEFVPIEGSENTLRIENVEEKHEGCYKCVVQNDFGTNEHVTTLNVEYLPKITINSSTIEGIQGDQVLRIPCDAIGVPPPVITWKINDATIKPNEKYFIEDGALVIVNPVEKDSSSYTCEATNSVGSVSATIQATVKSWSFSVEDDTITIKSPKVKDTISYTCQARNEDGSISATFKTYIRQAPQLSGVPTE